MSQVYGISKESVNTGGDNNPMLFEGITALAGED